MVLDWLVGFVDRISKLRITPLDRKDANKRREGLAVAVEQF